MILGVDMNVVSKFYFDVCVGKLGVWRDPFHLAGRLTTVLASQADADAEDDHGGSLSVQLPRVGWQVGHCERPGKTDKPDPKLK